LNWLSTSSQRRCDSYYLVEGIDKLFSRLCSGFGLSLLDLHQYFATQGFPAFRRRDKFFYSLRDFNPHFHNPLFANNNAFDIMQTQGKE
jgi:hypothetical protein